MCGVCDVCLSLCGVVCGVQHCGSGAVVVVTAILCISLHISGRYSQQFFCDESGGLCDLYCVVNIHRQSRVDLTGKRREEICYIRS